jgi:hypothetical protein
MSNLLSDYKGKLEQEIKNMIHDDTLAKEFLFFTYKQNLDHRFAFKNEFLKKMKTGSTSNNVKCVQRMEKRILDYNNIINKVNTGLYFAKGNPASQTSKEIERLGIKEERKGVGYYIRPQYLESVGSLYEKLRENKH